MKTPKEITLSLEDVLKVIDAQIEDVAEVYSDYKENKGQPLFDPVTQMKSVLSHTSLKIMELGFEKARESESET